MKVKIFIVASIMLVLSACASNTKHVPRHAKYQTVSYGLVLDKEDVVIGGTNTGIGSYVGSTAAIFDATSDSFLGFIARGLLGGIVGSATEEVVTRTKGASYTIEKRNGDVVQVSSKNSDFEKKACVKIIHSGHSHTRIESVEPSFCGSQKLAEGSQKLAEGSQKLAEGSQELAEGSPEINGSTVL